MKYLKKWTCPNCGTKHITEGTEISDLKSGFYYCESVRGSCGFRVYLEYKESLIIKPKVSVFKPEPEIGGEHEA